MTVSTPLISRPREARSVASRNETLPSRKFSTLSIRWNMISVVPKVSESKVTNLCLVHAAVQFGA